VESPYPWYVHYKCMDLLHTCILLISTVLGHFENSKMHTISVKFLPALTGRPLSDIERSIFFHYRHGGLGVGGFLTLDLIHL